MSTQKERWADRANRREDWALSAEAKAAQLDAASEPYRGDVAFWTQPGKLLERDRLHARSIRAHDLRSKAQEHRSKAHELQRLASTTKGDAERARQSARDTNAFAVGDRVISLFYGEVEVVKVNTKTYRVRTASGWETCEDKSYFKQREAT